MQNNRTKLLSDVADYYTDKLALYGETAQGVDWNGEGGQFLRFEQLCKIVNASGSFSINDLGCGYGALYDFLADRYDSFSYFGVDISENMIKKAQDRFKDKQNVSFITSHKPASIADYSIASGIFNVRLGRSDEEWQSYLKATLSDLDVTSRLGFAFNCLTSYSDEEKMRDYLYYANPRDIFDLCKRRYSRNVALIHDYDLYEFTILVRKES